MSKDLVSGKVQIKCSNIIKQYRKWLSLTFIKEDKRENNPNWPQIPDHSYRILITGGSGSGKTNSSFNLISQQPDVDKISIN